MATGEKGTGPILYFVEGLVPTNAEFAKASKYMNKGPILEFISLQNLEFNAEPMHASGVAGKVPEAYKHYPIVDKTQHVEIAAPEVDKKKE